MWFSNYKKTNYKPKGLIIESSTEDEYLKAESWFYAPKKIDHRDFCIPTDNQANTPYCVGYATAGYLEIKHWQKIHFPKQYPATTIYAAAKDIDGHDGDGSWIKYGVQGAKNMGLIKGNIRFISPTEKDIKFAILEFGACIGAFRITNEWNKTHIKNGKISNLGDKANLIGGHAVLICGYDEEGVYIQNSWGKEWGVWGFALLSWEQYEKQFVGGIVIDDLVVL